MNRHHLLQKAFRHQYRMYAFRISLIAHVIMILAFSFFFIKSQVIEPEDEIQVDIISPLPRQSVVKKKPLVIPQQEETTPVVQIPEKRDVQKQMNVKRPQESVEIAKMPVTAPTGVEVQHPALNKIGVEAPDFSDTSDLSTDADLPFAADAVLSPLGSSETDNFDRSYTQRSGKGVRTPGKGTGDRITKLTKKTKAGKGNNTGADDIIQAEPGNQGNATFSSVIKALTDDIIAGSGGGPIDVVFVVDASGSMGDNINAVAEHLGQMVDTYKASEIDYRLGLTHFNTNQMGQNNIQVWQLKRNLAEYKRSLYAIIPTGDEHALDAIDQTLREMQFRSNTSKHLILVTDEPFTSHRGLSVDDVIAECQQSEIFVNVLGNNIPEHQQLARQTGGTWHAVPVNVNPPQAPIQKYTQPKHAQWQDAQHIGSSILTDAANLPVDIILFIDGSKSMEDKIQDIQKQIDLWIRKWDNALIDYRLGVVRFQKNGSINRVNVFNPPQTRKQIQKILQLPAKDDENLIQVIFESTQRLKLRRNVKTHFIFITDEPGDPKHPIEGTIALLAEIPVVVSVWGTRDNFQKQVASQTGGVFVPIPNAHSRNTIYQ